MPSQAKREGNARHAAKLDQIRVQPPKEEGAAIRAAAAAVGLSVQRYVLEAVRERMEREGVPLKLETQSLESDVQHKQK